MEKLKSALESGEVTMAAVTEELDYRERSNQKWDDNLYEYTTEELAQLEESAGPAAQCTCPFYEVDLEAQKECEELMAAYDEMLGEEGRAAAEIRTRVSIPARRIFSSSYFRHIFGIL